MSKSFLLKKLEISDVSIDKYVVKMQRVKSPIQAFKVNNSNATSMRKFLQSISCSYSDEYLLNHDQLSTKSVYALLTVNENNNHTESNEIKMTEFIRRQLGLFEINPKILLNAEPVSKFEQQFSNTSKKKVIIKTNVQKSVT